MQNNSKSSIDSQQLLLHQFVRLWHGVSVSDSAFPRSTTKAMGGEPSGARSTTDAERRAGSVRVLGWRICADLCVSVAMYRPAGCVEVVF
jgi:hypothetical protein